MRLRLLFSLVIALVLTTATAGGDPPPDKDLAGKVTSIKPLGPTHVEVKYRVEWTSKRRVILRNCIINLYYHFWDCRGKELPSYREMTLVSRDFAMHRVRSDKWELWVKVPPEATQLAVRFEPADLMSPRVSIPAPPGARTGPSKCLLLR